MIGQHISHYRILEKLGGGGMGVVYKGVDTRLDRFVALKFLPPTLEQSEEEKRRFIREAKAASALEHKNICTIYEIDETDEGQLFIAMAFYDGESLKSMVERGPVGVKDVLDIGIQIAEGLDAAHTSGIVHRDVKSANVMITSRGEVKIVDFGLAKLAGRTLLTKEGTTLGTVPYMSPEQAQGGSVDHRTDIWALGVLLYELLTGRRPFGGDYEQAIIYGIVNEDPIPITGLRTGVPMELERIVHKSLAKDREERYQRADELLVDLRRVRREFESTGSKSPQSPGKRIHPVHRRATIAVGVLLVTVTLGLAAYFFLAGEAARPERLPIAVIDFTNETDERELDGLSGMLITALEQSHRLSVLTRARMFDILGQLQKQDVERIDESLGREICRFAGIELMATASVRKFGRLYTVDLKVLDRKNNHYLVTASSQGEGKERIPDLIDELAKKTREGLKERQSEIRASSRKLADVTTLNLEAYQHYFKGEELLNKINYADAIAEYQTAVELDSTFGLAHYRIGYAYHLLGRNDEAGEALDRALGMLDRIPEKEQYLARAYAAHLGHSEEEMEAGLAILRNMEQRYPNDKEMIFFIGDWSYHRRHYDTSLTYLERALAMDPTFGRALIHLALLFRDTGNYERMLDVARRNMALGENATASYLLGAAHARLKHHESAVDYFNQALTFEKWPVTYHELAHIYCRQNDYAKAEEVAREALDLDRSDVWSSYALGEVLLKQRRIAEAEILARRLVQVSPGFHSQNLLAHVLVTGDGDFKKGRDLALEALETKPARYRDYARTRLFFPLPEHTLGRAYVRSGEFAAAVNYFKQAAELAPLRVSIQQDLKEVLQMSKTSKS